MRSSVISLIVAFFVLRTLSASHRENRAQGLRPRQGEPIDTFTLTGYSPEGGPFYPSYNLSLPEDTLKLTSINNSIVVYSIWPRDNDGQCFFVSAEGYVTFVSGATIDLDPPARLVSAACFTNRCD